MRDLPDQLGFDFADHGKHACSVIDWIVAILEELPEVATATQLELAERLDRDAESLVDAVFVPLAPRLTTLRRRLVRKLARRSRIKVISKTP